jgi:hypothetical protein
MTRPPDLPMAAVTQDAQGAPVKTIAELIAAYPYMFEGEALGLALHRGWLPTFANLCHDVDELLGEDKRSFWWIELKEMSSAARWCAHYDLKDLKEDGSLMPVEPNLSAATIDGLINVAQDETSTLCIVCGGPAKVASHGGWNLCLCQGHSGALAQGRKLPNFEFVIGQDDPFDPWGECGGS